MQITRDVVLNILYESIDELNEQRRLDSRLVRSPDTRLLGEQVGLDSLGFINLIALIEERCQERFGKTLVLSDAASTAGT